MKLREALDSIVPDPGRCARLRDVDLRLMAKPVGVFVIKDGEASWVPLMGELIGLVSATFATLAMVRRPPWPDLRGTA